MTCRTPRPTRREAIALALAAAAAATASGAATAATPGLDVPPEPGPPRDVELPPFEQLQLANGLRVVVAPRPQLPLVAVGALVLAGREVDPPGRAGLAALTVELLTKGALRDGRPVPAPQIARQAEALGSSLDSGAGWRSASLGLTVTTPELPAAVALLADLVRRPLLAAGELERARAQALDALRVTLADPGAVAAMVARRAFWGRGPYAASATPASLQRIGRADVQGLHAAWYRPQRTVLLLVGDVDRDQARQLAEAHFGDWQVAGSAPPPVAPVAPAPIDAPHVLVAMPGSGQSGVVVAAPFVATDAADRRIADVAQAVLGGGFSARLNQQVRVRRGLSYGAFAGAESLPGGGMWTAQAQTQHGTAGQVLELLREETLRLATDAPSADELAARKAFLVGRFARRLQTHDGLLAVLGSQIAQGLPLAELTRHVEELRAVTPAQVQAFADRHWRAGALRGVVAGDLQAGGTALRDAAPQAIVRPLATLDLEHPALGPAPEGR